MPADPDPCGESGKRNCEDRRHQWSEVRRDQRHPSGSIDNGHKGPHQVRAGGTWRLSHRRPAGSRAGAGRRPAAATVPPRPVSPRPARGGGRTRSARAACPWPVPATGSGVIAAARTTAARWPRSGSWRRSGRRPG